MSAFAVDNTSPYDDDEPLPEPDYDHLELSFDDLDELEGGSSGIGLGDQYDVDCKESSKGTSKGSNFAIPAPVSYSQYILGTLIVRVVAARDLQPVVKGGLGQLFFGGGSVRNSASPARSGRPRGFNTSSANPYAKLLFSGQTQRTTEVYDSIDPVWPRGESSYFDVSLPVPQLAQEDVVSQGSGSDGSGSDQNSSNTNEVGSISSTPLAPPRPVLTVALFHSTGSNSDDIYPVKGGYGQNEEEPFLGMASVDLTEVLTGKIYTFDEWIPLDGTDDTTGSVRIVCEYETTDPPPRPGDTVRFTGFCKAADLYPVPPGRMFRVDEVDGDEVILSYTSPEGWLCTFTVHRFMLLCAVRHQAALEKYQDQIATVAERLAHSPLAKSVVDTVDRVPDDGLIFVGADAVMEGASLLGRWFKGGFGTALGDIVYATNWDGQHNPDDDDDDRNGGTEDQKNTSVVEEADTDSADEPLPGMPCCPITGEPMRDPVVAGDGHTYERSAISRWLHTSDNSPLTGGLLPHKELVPNYMLISSLSDSAKSSAASL